MYLHGSDYQTVWQLAHEWAGKDSSTSDSDNLPPEIKENIHRILVAIRNKLITVRTQSRVILADQGTFEFLLEIAHYRKFDACLQGKRFDKQYLDSLYVWRPEVIRWCNEHQLPIPSIWQQKLDIERPPESEVTDEHWYKALTDRRKRIAGALHIAARLWEDNCFLSYDDVWNHEDMKRYDKPRSFTSLESFKEWARDIAPQEAKSKGRRKISK